MRKILTALLLAITATTALAQPAEGTFSIIPRLGVSLANLTKDALYVDAGGGNATEMNPHFKSGMIAGVDFEYQIRRSLSVSAGAYYSEQGCKYDNYEGVVDAQAGKYCGYTNMRTSLKYVNVPLMLNMYATGSFAVKAGVQFGFNVDGNTELTTTSFVKKDDGSKEYQRPVVSKQDVKTASFDFSIPVGVSYEYMNVIIDARYNIGITKTYDVPASMSPKQSVITISAGYRFKL